MKRDENMNNIPSISKIIQHTPPWLGARTCKVSRKYSNINAFLSLIYNAKTKRDGRTDRQMDKQTDGGRCNIYRPRPYGAGER